MYFGNYSPSRFGWSVPAAADIVAFRYEGVSFPGGVHKLAVPVFTQALDAIVQHIPGGLKAGQCWGYEHRAVTGGVSLSFHAYGLAVDVNAPDNPYVAKGGKGWAHTLPSNTGALIRPLGLEWGGDWTRPVDPMHLEVHCSPAELSTMHPAPAPTKPGAVTFEAYHHGQHPGSRVVKLGSAGDDVKIAQRYIGSKWAGAADGLFGHGTDAGVRRYQRMRGVAADGIIGPITWRQMGM